MTSKGAAAVNLSELEIRAALIQSLTKGTAVFEEFPVSGGRLDLLAVFRGALAGFEIKSDFDSLQRVNAQVAAFSQYCDTLTFVAGRRSALSLLPRLPVWCGVSLAYRTPSGQTMLFALRYPRANPLVSATASVALLRRDELLALFAGKGKRPRARREELQDRLLAALSFSELRSRLSAALMLREQSRSDELQGSGGG